MALPCLAASVRSLSARATSRFTPARYWSFDRNAARLTLAMTCPSLTASSYNRAARV